MLNQGCPSWGWNARRQATHCVAPQRKASTTAPTARTWPQRILVAFMATEDQEAPPRRSQARIEGGRADGYAGEQIGRTVGQTVSVIHSGLYRYRRCLRCGQATADLRGVSGAPDHAAGNPQAPGCGHTAWRRQQGNYRCGAVPGG